MQKKIRNIVLSLIISFLFINNFFFNTVGQEEAGNEYYVDSEYWGYSKGTAEEPFIKIQDAIDHADQGDTIYVFGGLYEENLVVNKKLHLWGGVEGTDSIIEDPFDNRNTVEITADFVKFQDFLITDEHNHKSSPLGSLINVQADNVVLTGNTFNDTKSWGIFVDSKADGTIITGNNINNTKIGIRVESSTNDLFKNNVSNCSDSGVYLLSTFQTRLYDNQIEHCLNGVFAKSCSYLNITNNTFSGNEYSGVQLELCSHPIVQFNKFNESPSIGLYLNSDQGSITNNNFTKNERGITLRGRSNIIHSNNFTSCTAAGIFALSSSKLNSIYYNSFKDNGKNAEEQGDNTWYEITLLKGNYWDDYDWLDLDKDGIGDSSYKKNGLVDPYPVGYFLQEPDKPTNPTPEDGETGVGLKPTLKIKVFDNDSDTLTVTYFDAETGKELGFDRKVPNGTNAYFELTLPFDRTFAWYVIVDDGLQENQTDTFFFTTMVTPPDNIPPIADIGGPYEADVNGEIQFDASESIDEDGRIDFYRWNFGDGSSELLAEAPVHTYDKIGTYSVTLTVIDNQGTVDTKTILVPIGMDVNKAPTANPNGPYKGVVGKPLLFNGTGSSDPDGEITEFIWSFGDDSTGMGSTVSHTYTSSGSYLVILTVSDAYGESHAESTTVVIDPKQEGTPGFELLIFLCAVIIIYWKKNHLK